MSCTQRTSGTAGTSAKPCSGSKVDSTTIAGVPVTATGTYRITVNDFPEAVTASRG